MTEKPRDDFWCAKCEVQRENRSSYELICPICDDLKYTLHTHERRKWPKNKEPPNDDFYCRKCNVWRILEGEYKLICPSCADTTYAVSYPSVGCTSATPMAAKKEDFESFLKFFSGNDGRIAPLHELSRVLKALPPGFRVSDVYETVDGRYRKYSEKIHVILSASIETMKRALSNVPQVERLLRESGMKKKDYGDIAPKILRLSGFPDTRFLTLGQEEVILEIVADVRKVFPSVSEGRKYFLGYKYVLYKICEMCHYDEFLQDIELPAGKTLRSSDIIWARVCAALDYPYYPSKKT